MRTLLLKSKEGYFTLNGMDIGDYIEIGMIQYDGHRSMEFGSRTIKFYSFRVLLTLCSELMDEPEVVSFKMVSDNVASMLREYEWGSLLKLMPERYSNGKMTWYWPRVEKLHATQNR